MLGKLFGFGKKEKAAAPSPATTKPATTAQPKPARLPTHSLLDELTQGQAIENIQDAQLLQQLVKHSDKLDKKTNRLVRERLQQLKEQDKQQQQQREAQEKICSRLETLSRLQHHPLFDSELAHLQQQWHAIAQPDADFLSRVEAAILRCTQLQRDALELKQQQEALLQAAEQLALAKQQQEIKHAEQKVLEADQQQQAQERQKMQQAQSHAERAEHEKRQQAICHHLSQQLLQLEEAINVADGKKAREWHDKARDSLKKLDPKHTPQFDGKLHLLSGQLRDLQDWQAFAAMPKLEALCDEMDKLASIDLPPQQKADAVRELQTQWRAIKAPSDKQAHALWERFKQAGDKAWEPCAAYYEKEKQLRAFNLQQRHVICEALEQFFSGQNWDAVDWKTVHRLLDKARQEFHDFHPVERSEEKSIRNRFDSAIAAINEKLLIEQKANEDKKRQLIDTARNLAGMSDMEKAIDRVRQLQEQWKQIGITRRQEDQRLWQVWQEETNAIFNKRRAAQQEQHKAQLDRAEAARQLCQQIAELAKLPDAELGQSIAAFDCLQAEYKAITDIPEKSQGALRKQFQTACDAYRQQLAGISQRQHAQQLQELARRAQLCSQLESQASAATLAAVQENWQQLSLPQEWERAIDQRRQQAIAMAQNGQEPDYSANELRRRELCIELEILLDAETPEEDRSLRREYQMRKLQQGLGQTASGNRQAALERLLVQWYCASPANSEAQQHLLARFDATQAGCSPLIR